MAGDDEVWDHSTFTKNRDRLLGGEVALPVAVAADKKYGARECVDDLRCASVAPDVAQNTSNRSSAIDGRTTRHTGYATSQIFRNRIDECFGWALTIGGLRKSRFVGREAGRSANRVEQVSPACENAPRFHPPGHGSAESEQISTACVRGLW